MGCIWAQPPAALPLSPQRSAGRGLGRGAARQVVRALAALLLSPALSSTLGGGEGAWGAPFFMFAGINGLTQIFEVRSVRPQNFPMADPNTPVPPAPEPPKPADAAAKKQTVRISLPPKPAGGPSIKIPAAAAAPAAAPVATTTAVPAAAAPAAPPKPAVAAAPATPARPAPAPARPAAPAVSGVDVGLAFATVALAIGTIVSLLFLVPTAS
jgi:hypothetical protein